VLAFVTFVGGCTSASEAVEDGDSSEAATDSSATTGNSEVGTETVTEEDQSASSTESEISDESSELSETSGSDSENTQNDEDSSATGEEESDSSSDEGMMALVQYNADAIFGDLAAIRADLDASAIEARDKGATIIVFPEGSSTGYASASETWCLPGESMFSGLACRDVSEIAQEVPNGETIAHWSDFSQENQIYVVYWFVERDGDQFYNALGVSGPDGFMTRYRKRSLYFIDEAYASAGSESVTFATPWGKFGLMICLDGNASDFYYEEYIEAEVDGIILSMDWDQAPVPRGPASSTFRARAARHNLRIYAADVSPWDGTGLYLPGDVPREREGLSEPAVGQNGISYHRLSP
jgi:predicted amidohydrolase